MHLTAQVSSRRMCLAIWTTCLTVLGTITSPLLVTIDGYGYIRSAQSLFTDQLATGYRWYREPLYPLFLKAIHGIFGNSDWPLVFTQTGLLVVSMLLTGLSVELVLKRQFGWIWWGALGALTVNPFYLVYGGMVLKQSLIVFFVALFVFLGAKESVQATTSSRRMLFAGVVTICAVLCSESLAYVSLGLGCILGSARAKQKPIISGTRFRAAVHTLGFSLAGAGLVALISFGAWSGWMKYRESAVRPSSVFVTDSFNPGVTLKNQLKDDPIKYIKRVANTARGTVMLGPTDNTNGIQENPLWLSWQNMFHCGHWDGLPDDDSARADGYFALSCRSEPLMGLRDSTESIYKYAYQFASFVFLSAFILSLIARFRKLWILILIPGWLLFIHSQRYSNDRYGLPLFPVGSVILMVTMMELVQTIRQVFRRRFRQVVDLI